jgi:hypothetical protein
MQRRHRRDDISWRNLTSGDPIHGQMRIDARGTGWAPAAGDMLGWGTVNRLPGILEQAALQEARRRRKSQKRRIWRTAVDENTLLKEEELQEMCSYQTYTNEY